MTDVYQVSNYTPCQIGLVKGEKGESGANGANGLNGKDGKNGKDGLRGLSGSDGKSNYQLALDAGFIGSLDDYLLSMKCDTTELSNKVTTLESGLSAANTEIDKVKLDTGITATAKFGGVERTQADLNARVLTPEDFGAVGDGITDDSDAISKWLQMGGYLRLAPNKIYRVTKSSYGKSNTYIDGAGSTIYTDHAEGSNIGSLNFFGSGASAEVTTTTTASLNKDSTTASFSVENAEGFSIGDTIRILSPEYKHGIAGQAGFDIKTKGEFAIIKSIEGNTITLTGSLKDDYIVGVKTISRMGFIDSVTVKNTCFVGSKGNSNKEGLSSAVGARGIRVSAVSNIKVLDCSFRNYRRFAVDLLEVKGATLTGNTIQGYDMKDSTNQPTPSEWFTGVSVGSSEDIIFSNNRGFHCRRLFDADSNRTSIFTRSVIISNNIATNCINLVGTHSCQDVLVENNTGYGCGSMWIRGIDVTVRGNKLDVSSSRQGNHQGIRVGFGAAYPTDPSKPLLVGRVNITDNILIGSFETGISIHGDVLGLTISGNIVHSKQSAISILGHNAKNIVITNNNLTADTTAVIHIPNLTSLPRKTLKNVIISNNLLSLSGSGSGVVISGSSINSPADMITVSNNILQGSTLRAVGFTATGSDDNFGYYGNNIQVIGNLHEGSAESGSDLDVKPLHTLYPHNSTNKNSRREMPRDIGIVRNGVFVDGYTYEKGMYAVEENIQVGKPFSYVCTQSGTKGRTALIGTVRTTSGSDIVEVLNKNIDIPTGSYISLGGTGDLVLRVEAVNSNTLTVDKVLSTSSDVAIEWSAPVFMPVSTVTEPTP